MKEDPVTPICTPTTSTLGSYVGDTSLPPLPNIPNVSCHHSSPLLSGENWDLPLNV